MQKCLITKQYLATPCEHQRCKSEHVTDTLTFEIKSIDSVNFTVDGTFSTGMEDRHGEIVDQAGWDLTKFLKNPVVLFSHDDQALPVGQMIAIGTDEAGNLSGTIKFAVKEYEFAKTVFNLYAGRFMRAFSAGFINTDYEVDTENQRLVLKKNELLEVSCVNLPANALALVKQKDLNPADRVSLENYLTKSANSLIERVEKEGRVLSAKNRTHVENAHAALTELLKADNEKSISADTKSQADIKVETPVAPGGVKTSMTQLYKGRETIQKVLRTLLKVKADL